MVTNSGSASEVRSSYIRRELGVEALLLRIGMRHGASSLDVFPSEPNWEEAPGEDLELALGSPRMSWKRLRMRRRSGSARCHDSTPDERPDG